MQALERSFSNDYWITIIMVFLLIAIFYLKALDLEKLKTAAFSLFSRTFVEDEFEEDVNLFSTFRNILFLFTITVLSLLVYNLIVAANTNTTNGFYTFFLVFLSVFGYFIIKWTLEHAFTELLQIKKPIKPFLISKANYLYSASFFIFIALILVQYSQLNRTFLIYFTITLFSIRVLLHFINNKKLIFSKLFYFILYLCALEIAPLCILYKLMF